MSQTPARKLRTWSGFGQIRRKPSEYEIVTHDANYTTRKNRSSALEGNPTTPVNMWYLTYRDHSPLPAEDWNGFRDPDEVTYRKYVTMQDEGVDLRSLVPGARPVRTHQHRIVPHPVARPDEEVK